jgi:PAS domain S-box-containing protein
MYKLIHLKYSIVFLGISLCMLAMSSAVMADTVTIGVLSHRGDEATLKHWSPTADYLSRVVPEYEFQVVPLDFSEIEQAVKDAAVDFLLVNPGIYVAMEVRHRISRVATLNNLMGDRPVNVFGGVLFTRRGRSDINRLEDLVGKSMMAVDATSLGGFQMGWRQLHGAGIDPHKDLAELRFGGTHDAVVEAVMRGDVDAGTIRTDILADMAASQHLFLQNVKVLNQQHNNEFPFPHSTRLYPEWPFSKLRHTSNELAQRVVVALLQMSELEPAAQWGDYAGWTVPLEYQPVHELLKELGLPPYDEIGQFTLEQAVNKYWYWSLGALITLLTLSLLTTWVYWLNRLLRRSKSRLEQRHKLILDSVADGIYGVDLQGKSTFVNKAMEEMTGWRSYELIGAQQHELLHHTHSDGSPFPFRDCPIYHTFSDNHARFIDDDLFWRKDGTSFSVEYSSTPIRGEDNQSICSVVVFRDISERKRAQESARNYQQELAHVARLSTMGEMASGMAHELNQPLTAIAINADACIRLLESGQGEQGKLLDVLERIGTQARRAGSIIQQLRQFVRKEEPQRKSVDMNELIGEVLLLMQLDIMRAGVQVVTELVEDIPQVFAQHIQIDQVILNLIKNALESMADVPAGKRTLVITTEASGKHAVLTSVKDTGAGLSREQQERLFTPFQTTKPQGMGLGLSISQGIIDSHSGRLYLDSEPGFGAVFRFVLPTQQESCKHD